jgi:hypothetical protein
MDMDLRKEYEQWRADNPEEWNTPYVIWLEQKVRGLIVRSNARPITTVKVFRTKIKKSSGCPKNRNARFPVADRPTDEEFVRFTEAMRCIMRVKKADIADQLKGTRKPRL